MEFEVIRSNRKSMAVEIKLNKLIIRAPMQASNEEINSFMLKNKAWIEKHLAKAAAQQQAVASVKKLTIDEIRQLADKALEVIPERVKHYAPLVGVTYGRITIRNQRSKWGSCSSKGNLNFNCLLMENPYDAPFVLQEYEGNFTIDGIEYEVRACHTDFCYCGLFYLSDVQPFEFYMLFDTSTMSDGTVGGYSSATKKYLI